MQELRVRVNQIELQVRDHEHAGEAIIFLHFGGANLMMWQRAIPYFENRYRLILVDLRGHGKSDRPDAGYHIDDMARDVAGIMQRLQLERAHIVGSSLGAEVGLSLAANYTDKVISLVCDGALSSEYGPYGVWEGAEADFEEHVARQLDKMRNAPETVFPSLDALVANRRQTLESYGWWNEYVEAVERYGACQIAEGQYVKGFRKHAQADYLQHYFHCRFEDYYRQVRCPVLMAPGEDVFENERERAALEGLRDLAAQAQIARVSGWVHPYGWLLNPEGVCKAILKFLSNPSSLANPLVGTWRVIAFDDRQDESSPWQPLLGEHPVGYLVYDPTGHMSIQIMKTPPPPPFTAEGVWTESPEEAKLALDGYVAYFGAYSVDLVKQVVTHHVEGSLTPNLIGTAQARPFSIEGDRLVLGDGKRWRRVFERVR